MRAMAVRDFHASDHLQGALTERAGADHVFGDSPAARDIEAKWDRAVGKRVQEADELGNRTHDMAENLERAADEYRTTDDDQRQTFGGFERRLHS
jgi:hypothetical protein